MARRTFNFVIAWLVLFAIQSTSWALISTPELNTLYPKAISDLKEAIVKGLGFQAEDFKVSGFDVRDALVGHSVAYEFDIEIDNKVLPLKLLEDVHRWEYVDLPIFREDNSLRGAEKNGLVERRETGKELPVLAPFQLAGPMELWIQDAKGMRLSLPHDVDAGELRKVILADGAVVTVKGARSVSLRHPVELPLPLNSSTHTNFASGLLNLAEHLRQSSQGESLLSLRIVGPTSLTSPASSSRSGSNKLKLKRLAPGLVELSSRSKPKPAEPTSVIDLQGQEATTILTPDHFTAMWPLTSVNGSNPNLIGFEALLSSVLGPKANEAGSFKLLKADVSARTFVKMGFGVEKKLKEGDGSGLETYPEWRTKPKTVKMHFEVLGKVDGDKVVPERVIEVDPVMVEDSAAPSVLSGNMTMSNMPIVYPPPNPFAL